MKQVTITARSRKLDKAGERKIDVPQSMDEAVKIFGSKRNLVEAAMKHRIIEVQAEIRRELEGPSASTNVKGLTSDFEE